MLPLLSFVAVGAIAVVTIVRSKRRGVPIVQDFKKKSAKKLPPGTFKIVWQKIVAETEIVLATEDVPMDNRFGNQAFVSEHEFSRSAKVAIKIDLGQQLDSVAGVGLLAVLKAELHSRLERKLGVDMGTQISRHIRLKFTSAPGKKVLYRVVWKQGSQRGLFDVGVGQHIHQIPYMVTYGLTHAVQSIAIEDCVGDQPQD